MKVFYLRDEKRFPVALVASERSDVNMHDIAVALVTHNPVDIYDKDLAWSIAENRLNRGSKKFAWITNDSPHIKRRIIEYIANSSDFPKRARMAARIWLDKHCEN